MLDPQVTWNQHGTASSLVNDIASSWYFASEINGAWGFLIHAVINLNDPVMRSWMIQLWEAEWSSYEKLNDPTVMSAFQATVGGRFAPLATLVDEDADLDCMVTYFNKVVTDTATELLGNQLRKRDPWDTPEILDLCDQRQDLKKKRGEPEGAKDYREIKRKIRTRDEDGKRDLDTGSMPGSRSMPQKE